MRVSTYFKTGIRDKGNIFQDKLPTFISSNDRFTVYIQQSYVVAERVKLDGLLRVSGFIKCDAHIPNHIKAGEVFTIPKYSPMFAKGLVKLDGLIKSDELLITV